MFKILVDDHHDQLRIYVYRDKEQFYKFMEKNFSNHLYEKFDRELFEEDEQFDDGDTTWSIFTGIPEVDYQNDP